MLVSAADGAPPPVDRNAKAYGWAAIAQVLDRSEKFARKVAVQNRDPLPVFYDYDRPYAIIGAILDWRARQIVPYLVHVGMRRRKSP